jgi:hydrogenase-4 component F
MMLVYLLLATPLVAGILARLAPRVHVAEWLSVAGAVLTCVAGLLLVGRVVNDGPQTAAGGVLAADPLSALLVLVIVGIGLIATVASVGYLRHDVRHGETSPDQVGWYHLGLHAFVWTMLVTVLVDNLGLLWVAIESTTLASALLVGFYRTRSALEAAWKYLILCTVGITLALFGVLLTYYASDRLLGPDGATLSWHALVAVAPRLDPDLMKLAFVFVVIGFGAKAGFAPLHAWLPDAHSQAPSPVSGLLSGVLLNCALYGILRFIPIVAPSVGPRFAHDVLLGFGLLSVAVAVPFILVQRDLKRLLAYSSVEHIGLIAVAIGIGGRAAVFAGLLHLLNHAITKSLLFFAAGEIVQRYGTRRIRKIRGAVRAVPVAGPLFLLGAFAISGLPPSGIFLSELGVLLAAFLQDVAWVGLLVLALLAATFAGLCGHVVQVAFGRPMRPLEPSKSSPTTLLALVPLVVGVVVLGVWVPDGLNTLLRQAADTIGTGAVR